MKRNELQSINSQQTPLRKFVPCRTQGTASFLARRRNLVRPRPAPVLCASAPQRRLAGAQKLSIAPTSIEGKIKARAHTSTQVKEENEPQAN